MNYLIRTVPNRTTFPKKAESGTPHFIRDSAILQQAADGNRTGDLRTTNATHYRLCYSSITSEIYNTIVILSCQQNF